MSLSFYENSPHVYDKKMLHEKYIPNKLYY